ncbi:MAG: glycosyl hydrolase [Vicinamibacterales bacterium]
MPFVLSRRPRLARLLFGLALIAAAGTGLAARQAPATAPAARPEAPAKAPAFDSASFSAMAWRNIGPFRGGRAVAVAGVPQQPRTFYFGSVGGGVWKTTDGGVTWGNITDGQLKTSSVGAIAVAPSDPNVIYVGMGEHPVRGVMTSHGDGVYKSTDAGRTWTHMGLDRTRQISRIRVHPTDPDTVWVAAQGAPYGPTKDRGVYKSIDGGTTWTQQLFVNETTGPSDLAIDPTNPRILYAAMWDHLRQPWEVRSGGPGSGIHKTTDGGATWQKVMEGLPTPVGKIGIDVSANPDRLYAVVEADPKGGVYRSDDAGKHWTLMSDSWSLHARAWYYLKIVADPKNPDVVWVLNAPVSRSIDGGKTWTSVRTPHGDNHSLWINPDDPDTLIESNDGGANVSFNGGRTWSTQSNQPTAQFYRVNADNLFPYNLYGGQQDNTSVKIASASPGGITERDWYDVGGCESAVPAFDPDKPRYVYAGCYMGIISEFDDVTKTARDVMAWPGMPAAIAPRDMKYRFNWSAPIVVSRFDPNVIYHGGNVLLRSANRGKTWTEASPDLTRNDKSKQGPGGAPITNEGAGGETYGVIHYIAESPHAKGTLWVGTDDGLVQLTRDDGRTWTNVTPPDIGESLVNAIEVSPHAAGTAYVTFTKYKFNDFTPIVVKTTDFGTSWTSIVNGIEPEAWARVVREDSVRRDLLYLGTETGFYLSFNGGRQWTRLQMNLPVTPITDLKVHEGDLLAATAGRAFWILDDLAPFRQWSDETAATDVRLFTPREAYRTGVFAGGFGGGSATAGANPPNGAIVDFWLAKVPEGDVTMDVLDAGGQVVRAFSTKKPDASAPPSLDPPPATLTVKAGLNRVVWNVRRAPVVPVPGLYTFGFTGGRQALPGAYQVRLRAAGKTLTAPLTVRLDPRVTTPMSDLVAQDTLGARVETEVNEIHRGVIRLRNARAQVEDLVSRAKTMDGGAAIEKAGTALVDRLNALEDTLVQKKVVDGQTVINYTMRMNEFYLYLRGAIDDSQSGITDGQQARLADLSERWQAQQKALAAALGDGVEEFNTLVRARNIPAVVVRR